MRSIWAVTVIGAIVLAESAAARTITVAKDGSGEFSVIQDALDVAQPGDVIEVGPGRYDDMRLVQFPLEQAYIALLPDVSGLTIRGAGSDQTFVGFGTPTPLIDGKRTSGLGILEGITGLRLEDVRLEHLGQLVNLIEAATFMNCTFLGPTEYAVALLDVDGASFTGCSFEAEVGSNADFVVGFSGGSNPNTTFTDCTFSGLVGTAVDLTGASNTTVERCQFSGMLVGLVIRGAAGSVVRDCTFDSINNVNLVVDAYSDLLLDRCTLGGTLGATLEVRGPATRLVGTQDRLHGSGLRTLYTLGGVDIQLSDGDILNGGGLTVEALSQALYTPRIDLRNNYWGTTDLDQIASWIQDGNDPAPPGYCWYCPAAVVQYDPILSGTVPAEEASFGSLKARFGGDRQ